MWKQRRIDNVYILVSETSSIFTCSNRFWVMPLTFSSTAPKDNSFKVFQECEWQCDKLICCYLHKLRYDLSIHVGYNLLIVNPHKVRSQIFILGYDRGKELREQIPMLQSTHTYIAFMSNPLQKLYFFAKMDCLKKKCISKLQGHFSCGPCTWGRVCACPPIKQLLRTSYMYWNSR